MVLHILIFTFLDNICYDKVVWTEWRQALLTFNLLLISSLIEFWFAAAVPKYFTFTTFSKI
jgi:hypothetical protein